MPLVAAVAMQLMQRPVRRQFRQRPIYRAFSYVQALEESRHQVRLVSPPPELAEWYAFAWVADLWGHRILFSVCAYAFHFPVLEDQNSHLQLVVQQHPYHRVASGVHVRYSSLDLLAVRTDPDFQGLSWGRKHTPTNQLEVEHQR